MCSSDLQDSELKEKPDYIKLTDAYLGGQSYRELISIYQTAPVRLNQKINIVTMLKDLENEKVRKPTNRPDRD